MRANLEGQGQAVDALPGTLEPGFYVVPRRMSFPQVLLQLAEHAATLPISLLQRLNPTFEQGFKAGEIFVMGDPDNEHAWGREERELMAAAQHARCALKVLDFAEADFMMQHQADIAGLLGNASLSMGVGRDKLDQGLERVIHTLMRIEQLHINYSPAFFAERRQLLQQLDDQLKAAFLNKQLNLGRYERLKNRLNISTRCLVHHWSKAGGPGQIAGYATHLDKVARLGKYLKEGGHAAIGLGGTSSCMNIQKVCRAGETQVCKKIRMTEAVSFAGSLGLSALVSTGAGLAAGTLCAAFAVGAGGISVPVCGILRVGAEGAVGGLEREVLGENVGEFIHAATSD